MEGAHGTGRGWNWVICKVLSNPNYSVVSMIAMISLLLQPIKTCHTLVKAIPTLVVLKVTFFGASSTETNTSVQIQPPSILHHLMHFQGAQQKLMDHG